jgi:hypothetical protein
MTDQNHVNDSRTLTEKVYNLFTVSLQVDGYGLTCRGVGTWHSGLLAHMVVEHLMVDNFWSLVLKELTCTSGMAQ